MTIDHAHILKKKQVWQVETGLAHPFLWMSSNLIKSSLQAESTFLFPTYLGRSKETLLAELVAVGKEDKKRKVFLHFYAS